MDVAWQHGHCILSVAITGAVGAAALIAVAAAARLTVVPFSSTPELPTFDITAISFALVFHPSLG